MNQIKVFRILSYCALATLMMFSLSSSMSAHASMSPQSGSISGICRYYGNLTLPGPYTMDVCAHTDPNGPPIDDGCVDITFPGGNYTISGLPDDDYYVSCVVSLDGSGGQPEAGDPADMYDPDSDGDYDTVTVSGGEVKNVSIALGTAVEVGRLIIFVDKDATGDGDGTSWQHAFTELPPALSLADSALAGVEIWIAEGTYTTTVSTRTTSFQLKNNVEIYGGFAGTEILREQRRLTQHTTILSGQIGESADTDNTCHVVVGSGVNNTSILADVTIMGGYAKSGALTCGSIPDEGGGMLVVNGSPKLANVRFLQNYAGLYGGGMSVSGASSSVYILNSLFHHNTSGSMGGGLIVDDGAHVRVINGTFVSNACNPGLTYGGGIHSWGSSSDTRAHNTILSGNTPRNLYSTDFVDYGEVNYGLVEGGICNGFHCINTLTTSPEFVDPDGPDNIAGNLDDNFQLLYSSPAIDAGSNSFIVVDMADLDGDGDFTESTPLDFYGTVRRSDLGSKVDTGSGTSPFVDMGAFEILNNIFLPIIQK